MIYALNFLGNIMLGYAVSAFLRIALNKNVNLTKLSVFIALLINASMSLITFVIPYTTPIAIKLTSLIISMVIKYFCYWYIFKKDSGSLFSKSIIYCIVLVFSINRLIEEITNLSSIVKYREYISAYMLHAVILGIILLLIKSKKCESFIYEALRMIPKFIYAVILVFFFLASLVIWALTSPDPSRIDKYRAFDILILPMLVCLILIISSIIQKSIDVYMKRIEINQLTHQIENQVKYYQEISRIYSDFRKLRHDLKNHFICLKSLLAKNETERAIIYINDIAELANVEKKIFDTGSIIVDALLNDKIKKTVSVNAKIEFNGAIPSKGITNVDLCIIMANAIDNAIEALAKNTERDEEVIRIDADYRQGYLFLRITNRYFDKIVMKKNNEILTTKKNKQLHGFGISSIIKTAEKYNGCVDINTENDTFSMDIQLRLNNSISV